MSILPFYFFLEILDIFHQLLPSLSFFFDPHWQLLCLWSLSLIRWKIELRSFLWVFSTFWTISTHSIQTYFSRLKGLAEFSVVSLLPIEGDLLFVCFISPFLCFFIVFFIDISLYSLDFLTFGLDPSRLWGGGVLRSPFCFFPFLLWKLLLIYWSEISSFSSLIDSLDYLCFSFK